MLLQFSFSSFVLAKAESQETESCQTHGLCSLPKEHGRASPRGTPAQLRPQPPTPICSPRHWGRGVGGPTAGVSGPARHAWGGPDSRTRRGLKRKLGTAEVARETRRAERAAAAHRLLLRGPASTADTPPPQPGCPPLGAAEPPLSGAAAARQQEVPPPCYVIDAARRPGTEPLVAGRWLQQRLRRLRRRLQLRPLR